MAKTISRVALCALMLAHVVGVGHAREAALHVAPSGNDTDAGTLAKPFATLTRARDG
jgi:hypothetical protein